MQYQKVRLQDFATNVFVGVNTYPNLTAGLLTTQKDENHDDPKFWAANRLTIPQITQKRRSVLHSASKLVATQQNQITSIAKEIAMAKRSTSCEIEVLPRFHQLLENQHEAIPFGPRASLFSAKIAENVRVKPAIEKAVGDTDAKAQTSITELWKKQISEYEIVKLLSVGNLGVDNARKFVPTKWSITAVDDMLGKSYLSRISEYDTHEPSAFFGEYLGNYFLILLFDTRYGFEFIEHLPNGVLKSDCELTTSRTSYVSETAGAYYATRLGILEYLTNQKKQAGIVVLRIITEEYHTPLGVWVVRETIKNALAQDSVKGIAFSDNQLLWKYAQAFLLKKFKISHKPFFHKSILLTEILTQKNLTDFFS